MLCILLIYQSILFKYNSSIRLLDLLEIKPPLCVYSGCIRHKKQLQSFSTPIMAYVLLMLLLSVVWQAGLIYHSIQKLDAVPRSTDQVIEHSSIELAQLAT